MTTHEPYVLEVGGATWPAVDVIDGEPAGGTDTIREDAAPPGAGREGEA